MKLNKEPIKKTGKLNVVYLIDIEIKYNNRKLLSGIIKECNVSEDKITPAILIVDKLEKISKKELYQELETIGISTEQSDKLFSCFNLNIDELKIQMNTADTICIINEIYVYMTPAVYCI